MVHGFVRYYRTLLPYPSLQVFCSAAILIRSELRISFWWARNLGKIFEAMVGYDTSIGIENLKPLRKAEKSRVLLFDIVKFCSSDRESIQWARWYSHGKGISQGLVSKALCSAFCPSGPYNDTQYCIESRDSFNNTDFRVPVVYHYHVPRLLSPLSWVSSRLLPAIYMLIVSPYAQLPFDALPPWPPQSLRINISLTLPTPMVACSWGVSCHASCGECLVYKRKP